MNKALKVLILSLTTYCLWGGMSANAATVHQFSATDAGKLQKPDTMVVMKDVTVVGNRQHDFQMRTSVNNINIDRSYASWQFCWKSYADSQRSSWSQGHECGLWTIQACYPWTGIQSHGSSLGWNQARGTAVGRWAWTWNRPVFHRQDRHCQRSAALLYGSDAIGGVINLYNNYIPTKPYQGSVSIFSRSNNESIGASARLEGKAEISSGAPTSRLSITLISRFQQIVFSTIHTIST